MTRRNIELTPFVVEVDLSMLVKLPNQNFKQAILVFYAWTSRSLAAQLNHNWIRLNCVFKKKKKTRARSCSRYIKKKVDSEVSTEIQQRQWNCWVMVQSYTQNFISTNSTVSANWTANITTNISAISLRFEKYFMIWIISLGQRFSVIWRKN